MHKVDAHPDADERRERSKRALDEEAAAADHHGEAFENRYVAYRSGCCLYVEEIGASCPITPASSKPTG